MNRKQFGILMVVGLVVAGASSPARAQLVGTSVTGTLNFDGQTANAFNPIYGGVPAGYGNSQVAVSFSVLCKVATP